MVLVNNLLEYLDNAKIRSSEFGCFRAKMVKNFDFYNFKMKKYIYM